MATQAISISKTHLDAAGMINPDTKSVVGTSDTRSSASDRKKRSGFAARWKRIHIFAQNARTIEWQVGLAILFVIFYNVLGVLDIISTTIGLRGLATEANPFVRSLMDNFSHGWIYAKLGLQTIVTLMILWFPHRLVLGIFFLPMAYTGYIVVNNLQIVGML